MSNLKERNQKVLKRIITDSDDMRQYRESFKRIHKFDPLDSEKLPVMKEGFSWSKVAAKCGTTIREAEVSTAFVQLLRAGVQQLVNSSYELADVTYDSWVTTVPSNKREELYAPLQGLAFPNEVAEGGLYPEVTAQGLNMGLLNRKFGSMLAISKELLEDDQTGQWQRKCSTLGEYLRVLVEVLCYAKLASPSGGVTYLNFHVPASETQPSGEANYPWTVSTSPFIGGGFNRPAAFGVISQANIQTGIQALMGQKDLQGNIMKVDPKKILLSPKHRFDIAVLLNSSYYPSGAAAAGNVGGAFAINPIQSVLEPVITPYMPKNDGTVNSQSEAWYLVDSARPFFVLQMREAASVIPEAVNSGESFSRDIMRYKGSMRCAADFVDPRFAWQGDDGSV